jgi:hypothetical protein
MAGTGAMRKFLGAGAMAVAVVLGVSSGATAATKHDKKAYKAFLSEMNAVQAQAAQVRTAAGTGADATGLRAPCTQLGQTVATAKARKRPKLVKAAVWVHVVNGYTHYKAAAAACLLIAPSTSHFADTIHELSEGNQEIRQVQAALGL